MINPTETEREQIRSALLTLDEAGETFAMWRNEDGTVAGEVAGVIFDAVSIDELLWTLAGVVGGDA